MRGDCVPECTCGSIISEGAQTMFRVKQIPVQTHQVQTTLRSPTTLLTAVLLSSTAVTLHAGEKAPTHHAEARVQEVPHTHTHPSTIHDTADGLTFTRSGCLQGCSSSNVLAYCPLLPPPSPSLPAAAPAVSMTSLFPSLREMRSTKRPIDLFADSAESPTEAPGAAVPATLSRVFPPLGMLRVTQRVCVCEM